ncbi:hypothetical protein ACRALDRAFT_209664 [Sodiomyces alcalophilus JCM 7366]|uniref:uncharacterized protein n=1 Tax=Sodiomyces alcalophilus JCM 7366 TaxID=591952 RepID=UPI0039B5807D
MKAELFLAAASSPLSDVMKSTGTLYTDWGIPVLVLRLLDLRLPPLGLLPVLPLGEAKMTDYVVIIDHVSTSELQVGMWIGEIVPDCSMHDNRPTYSHSPAVSGLCLAVSRAPGREPHVVIRVRSDKEWVVVRNYIIKRPSGDNQHGRRSTLFLRQTITHDRPKVNHARMRLGYPTNLPTRLSTTSDPPGTQ